MSKKERTIINLRYRAICEYAGIKPLDVTRHGELYSVYPDLAQDITSLKKIVDMIESSAGGYCFEFTMFSIINVNRKRYYVSLYEFENEVIETSGDTRQLALVEAVIEWQNFYGYLLRS